MSERYGTSVGQSSYRSIQIAGKLFMPILVVCILAGCVGILYSPLGKVVQQNNRIPIADEGEHAGSWSNDDLTLDYEYMRNKNTLEISGTVNFAHRVINSFQVVTYFHMDLFLSDAQGRVIAVQPLMNAYPYSRSADTQSFARSIVLPQGTASMAFSYSGEATGHGKDRTYLSFWNYPVF